MRASDERKCNVTTRCFPIEHTCFISASHEVWIHFRLNAVPLAAHAIEADVQFHIYVRLNVSYGVALEWTIVSGFLAMCRRDTEANSRIYCPFSIWLFTCHELRFFPPFFCSEQDSQKQDTWHPTFACDKIIIFYSPNEFSFFFHWASWLVYKVLLPFTWNLWFAIQSN